MTPDEYMQRAGECLREAEDRDMDLQWKQYFIARGQVWALLAVAEQLKEKVYGT